MAEKRERKRQHIYFHDTKMREKVNSRISSAPAKHILSFVCCLCLSLLTIFPQTSGQPALADSLKEQLSETTGTAEVDLLVEISQSLWFISFEESMEYATRAYHLAKKLNYPQGEADALNRIGNVHYFLRNHDDVINNYNLALSIAESLNDINRMGIYLNNIGLLYRELNQLDTSAYYLNRALQAKEKLGDKRLISSTLNNLGHLYRDKKQYNQALEYFVRQLDILEESKDLSNLVTVHRQTAEVFYRQEKYNESVNHLMQSLYLARDLSDSIAIAIANSLLGRSFLELDETEEAYERITTSLGIANRHSSKNLIRNNYNLMYRYYKKSGDYRNAFDYMQRYSTLKDSLRTRAILDQTLQLEAIFETEKQNNKIQLLQMENQIQEIQITRQKNINISLVALVLLLIILKMIVFFRFRAIQKTNKLLGQKIGELEKTNDKLRMSALALEQLNATKNRFFSIIAHDLKNPFNALLGFSEMISSSFDELTEQEILEYIGIINQSSQNLFKLLENLLKWSAASTGKMHYLPEDFDIVSLIHSEINFFSLSARKKNISIYSALPDEIIVNSDKLLLSSVIRNLIDNAIKFTNPGGNIEISASLKNREVKVEIADTGIGIPYDIQKKLFIIDGDTCRKGTNKEEGGGLGLILGKELIEKAGGKIGFQSVPGKGSTFWFSLPLKQ